MRKHTSNRANTAIPKIRSFLKVIEKPEPAEYPAYAHIYIDLLPDDGQILKHLEDDLRSTRKFIASIPKARLLHRYAEGKWTSRKSLRTLWMMSVSMCTGPFVLRGATLQNFRDSTKSTMPNIPTRTNGKSGSLLGEFAVVRQSTIALFNSLEDAALMRTGVADGRRVSVRALAYHIAGHELRHLNIIKERYLR